MPVIVLAHLSEAQRRALVIADNQLALNSGWDEEMLQIELALLQEADYDLGLVGFEDEELARILAAQDAAEGLTDEDAVPELEETPTSVTGDCWILGDHRVLCGDATIRADLDRLMAGDAVDLVFTDPPYNVDYEGYTEDRLKIKGDRMTAEQFHQFLLATFSSYRSVVKRGASMYVCHSSSWQREFQGTMEAASFEVRCQIIWAKNTFAWGFGPLQVPSRAHLLRSRGRTEGRLVRGQDTIDSLAGEEAGSEPDSPNSEACRISGARAGQQQQGRRHRGRSLRGLGFHADRL